MDEKEFFHQGSVRICGTLDEKRMLEECSEFLKSYIPLNGLLISVYHRDSGSVQFISYTSKMGITFSENSVKLSATDIECVESTTGSVLLFDRLEDNPISLRMKKVFNLPEMSSIVLRLAVEEQRIGAIIAFAMGNKKFTREHGRILSILHDPFAIAISNILRFKELVRLRDFLKDANIYLQQELRKIQGEDPIIGADSGLKDVMDMVSEVAPLESKVLITGETGVGKELIASCIHNFSKRRNNPFVKINCGAIPYSLIDSELFGHEKGAFTGAVSRKKGRFERAESGTLFLDEIGELPLNIQARLLRVLQTGEYERVGGTYPLRSNVRIIAATNRNLEELVKKGEFREDLWFRLNVFPVFIPPLRQRIYDIPALLDYFLDKKIKEMNLVWKPLVDDKSMARLIAYNWPGNIREFENSVEREIIKSRARKRKNLLFNELIDNTDNSALFYDSKETGEKDETCESLDNVVKQHIEQVLMRTGGKIQGSGGASEILGVHSSTLRHRMDKLGIEYGRGLFKSN